MSGKLICHSVALKKGGVYPPFKQLKLNFLPIFGLFWASFVFLFTCLVFNVLHYMNNVIGSNGCFPLFIRVSGLFAILPFITPSLSPFISNVLILVVAFFVGYSISDRVIPRGGALTLTDTVVITKIDTIRIVEPKYITKRVTDTIRVPYFDTLRLKDTLYQILPRTQKYYAKDSVYQAWVSGYRPALDSINIFQKNVTETVTIRVPQKKWGVGIIGGYGVGENGLSPYVGVGLYYRIW